MSTKSTTLVFPDLYAYSLRVDQAPIPYDPDFSLSDHLEQLFELFTGYIETKIQPDNEAQEFIVSHEIASSGKPHLQAIVWFVDPLTPNNMSQIRNYWRKFCADTYQPVSFTKSIKPDSLASYCLKDTDLDHCEFVTTLTCDELNQIPKWRDSLGKLNPKKKYEQFESQCKVYLEDNPFEPCYYTEYGVQCDLAHAKKRAIMNYLIRFSQIYFNIYHAPLRRMSGLKILLELGILAHYSYIESLYGNFFLN